MYIFGIDPTKTRASTEGAEFDPGQIGFNIGSDGSKGYIYVQDSGSGITGDGYIALVGSDGKAVMSSTAAAAPATGTGKIAGAARAAIAANGYGWLQIFGPGAVRVLASAVAYTTLNTTATAGAVDDDATTGARVIDGIVIDTANGASAGSVSGMFNWPRVGRTL